MTIICILALFVFSIVNLLLVVKALNTAALVGVRAGVLPHPWEHSGEPLRNDEGFIQWVRWLSGVVRGELWKSPG